MTPDELGDFCAVSVIAKTRIKIRTQKHSLAYICASDIGVIRLRNVLSLKQNRTPMTGNKAAQPRTYVYKYGSVQV